MTILFIPSNDHHVNIFNPIYNILREKHKILFLTQDYFKHEGAEGELLKLGINFKKITDFEKIEPEFILNSENVKLVVVGNDTDVIPQWFVNYCNEHNIPSVLIQDGVQFDFKSHNQKFLDVVFNKNKNFKLQKLALKLKFKKYFKKISYGLSDCTQIHVWGNSQKTFLVKRGVKKNKIFVTGYPFFNKISIIDSKLSKSVLYAPSDLVFSKILNSKSMRNIVNTIYSTLSTFNDIKVVVKPHPREKSDLFEIMDNKSSNISVLDTDFFELMNTTSLVISDISSTILEALISKKHVIVFLPHIHTIVNPNSFPLDLVKLKIVHLAENKKQLLDILPTLLSQKVNSNSNALSTYLGPMDGKESLRSAKLILELID